MSEEEQKEFFIKAAKMFQDEIIKLKEIIKQQNIDIEMLKAGTYYKQFEPSVFPDDLED